MKVACPVQEGLRADRMMKVMYGDPILLHKEMMVSDAASCTPETNLAAAAMLMWERDCGTLPIVADDGKVVGMMGNGEQRNRKLA